MIIKLIFILSLNLLLANQLDLYDLQIIATTNNNGEIEPCGWKKKPLGGLARKATLIDEINLDDNSIIVDAGNLLFKDNSISKGVSYDISKITSEIIINSFNEIGCHAFSPGVKDFSLGLDVVREMELLADFPFISANIKDTAGNLLFEPYTIEEVNGIKIAIIGLSSKFNSTEVIIDDPITALSNVVDEIASQVNFTLLLFSAIQSDINLLNNESMPIDFIIRSNSTIKSRDGGTEAIPMYSIGDKGKNIFKFIVSINDLNLKNFVDIPRYDNIIDRNQKQLDKLKEGNLVSDLYEIYKDDDITLNKINTYERLMNDANAKISESVNTIKFTKYELDKKVIGKTEILEIVDYGKGLIEQITGPPMPDSQGRPPGHPHHGHNH